MTHLQKIVMEKAILLNIMDQKAWQTNVTLTNIIILKKSDLHCYKDYNNFYFPLVQGGGGYY